MSIPTANTDEDGKWIFVDNDIDYKHSIMFLKQVANSDLSIIYRDMNHLLKSNRRFVTRDSEGRFISNDLFTAKGFVKHGLCGLFGKRLGTYDNVYYKCPMLSNDFALLNKQELIYSMEAFDISVGCDNKSMCKAHRIKHRLKISYYRNYAEAAKDIIDAIKSVKNFINKI